MRLVELLLLKTATKLRLIVESERLASPCSPCHDCKCNLLSFQDKRFKTKESDQVNLSDSFILNRNQIALDVESERIELSSKQVTKGLSTRLFFS